MQPSEYCTNKHMYAIEFSAPYVNSCLCNYCARSYYHSLSALVTSVIWIEVSSTLCSMWLLC